MLYTGIVFLHIIAAAFWVGGMLFLALVVVPSLRDNPQRALLIERMGRRFEYVGVVALLVLLATGLVNLAFRGVTSLDMLWASPVGRVGAVKLLLFVLMALVALWHNRVVGQRAVCLLQAGDPAAERMRRLSLWVGRIILVLALVLMYLGVLLVRGVGI